MKEKWTKLVLSGLIFSLVTINLVWLYFDKLPPAWDSAAHLKSIIFASQWLNGRFEGSFRELLGLFWGYPPLIYFLGAIWGLAVGLKTDGLVFLNTFFLIGVVFGTYKLTKEIFKEEKVAVIVAIIFSMFPVIGEISRNMLLDLPLLVWVVWGLYFWLKSDDLKKTKYAWGLLIMLILASLTKLNGFLYFIPIGILVLTKEFRNNSIWLKLVVGGVIYGLMVGWWWIINWSSIYQYLTGLAGQGEALTDPMNLINWQTWIYYFKLLFLHQIGPITTVSLLIFGWFVPKNLENKKMAWWVIMVYIIFTIIKNKDLRFTLPILIPMAIWLGWGIVEFGKRRSKKIGVIIMIWLLMWLGFNFWENAFNWPVKKPLIVSTKSFLFENIDWLGFDNYPVREIRKEIWPNEEIIYDLDKIAMENGDEIKMLMLVNIEEINDNNLNLYGLMRFDQRWIAVPLGLDFEYDNNQKIQEIVKKYNYFLIPEKTYQATPFYTINLKSFNLIRDWIWVNIEKFEIVQQYNLPSGKEIYLVRRK